MGVQNRRWRQLAVFVCIASLVPISGCGSEPEAAIEMKPRRIKHMTLQQQQLNQQRLIAGVVSPAVSSEVAFEISGRIQKLNASVGTRVKTGDLLAVLDKQTYELRVQSAQGALQRAKAQLTDAEKKYDQQKKLFAKKFTTKTNFDTAVSNLDSAKSDVSIKQSELQIAERDLRKTELTAPFTGAISEKYVEVFEEVTAGKAIVQLHTEGNYEIDVSLPETLVNDVAIGDKVDVKLSLGSSKSTEGYVKEISSQAGQGNAFPVTIGLNDEMNGLRPGMSAEVTFRIQQNVGEETYAVPVGAVLTSGEAKKGYVFAFNKRNSTVDRRNISVVNVRDNDLIITGEVKAGDIIATAGVTFLHDKMKVRISNGEKK